MRVATSPLPLFCCLPRALSGRLRLGLAEQSVLAALAQAVSLTPPGQGEALWSVPTPSTRVNRVTLLSPKSTRPRSSPGSFPGSLVSVPCFTDVACYAPGVARGSAGPQASAGGLFSEFPPGIVDAGKGRTAEARKMWLEEQGMILKQTFW